MRAIKMLVAALSLQAAVVVSAQPVQVLHPTTSSWRYLADGSDQGAAWQAAAFDDSTWPQGLGLFGNENNYPYPMGTTIAGGAPVTVYYRAHFNWSAGTVGVVLTGTNYVDDGSIIFLNGVEIARFNMPAGPATFDLVAVTANPGGFPNVNNGEPVLVQLQIPLGALTNGNPNPLITGDNVIAVEVHQNAAGSSDRVHGLALYGQQAVAPCTDGNQPTNRTVLVGRSTTFTVVEQCAVPTASVQWYRDVGAGEELIAGATATAYTLSNAAPADAGRYYARLTNPSGSVDSRQAVLTVDPDLVPPRLLTARVVGPGLNTFRLTTDEELCGQPDPGMPGFCGGDYHFGFNWHIYQSDDLSVDLGVQGGVQINPTTYEFTTELPRDPTKQYRITVAIDFGEVISDLYQNYIPAVEPAPYAETGLEINFQQNINGYTGTQDTGIRSGTPDTIEGADVLINVDGDDNGIHQALLRFDNIFGTAAGQIPPGAVVTSAILTLNQNNNGDQHRLHRMLINWDQSTATWNTMVGGINADGTEAVATADATGPGLNGVTGPIEIDVTTSVQAWAAGAPNYGWGFITVGSDGWRWDTSESPAPPILTVQYTVGVCTDPPAFTAQPTASTTVNERSSFSLSAGVDICGDAAFQWTKDNVDITGANAVTYSVASAVAGVGGSGGTYRLRASNQFGTVTSDPAVVTVTPDTARPRVTRVVNGSDATTITIAFSEPVTSASAQSAGNYTLTPSVAVNSAVLGANNTVTLTTDARTTGIGYSLSIAGISDTAAAANLLDPNPTVVNLTSVSPVAGAGYGDAWLYNTNNLDTDPTWKDTGYTPGADWLTGNALFGTEPSTGIIAIFPVPIATVIPPNDVAPGDFVTSYYRKSVTLAALPAGAIYVIDHFIDDGAIFYWDGVEIGRYNMPAGAAPYSTRATAGIEASRQALRLPASASAGGTHTLAVEVHQAGNTTTDIVFGADIRAVTPQPVLSISHSGGANTVSWSGDSSWRLVRSAVVQGPYAAVAGNPFHSFVVPPAANTNNSFFMLQYVPAP